MEIWDGRSARGRREFAEYALLSLNPMDVRHREGYMLTIGALAGIPISIPGARLKVPEEIRWRAIQEFVSVLRGLTNQWIDSGKRNGGEQPWDRSVRYVSVDYPESIEEKIIQFWKRNPPTVLFHGNNPVLSTQSTVRYSDWAHLAGLADDRLMDHARDNSVQQFALLMDSPSRYRIFRCENCHSYFTKERMPKKGVVINSGSYCERCEGEASKRRVEDARKHRRAQMIGWAADAMERWKPRNRFGEKINWIVKSVNANLEAADRETIKTNWVSLHLAEIEAEVERRKYAQC